MKKLLVLSMAFVFTISLLTGCGSNIKLEESEAYYIIDKDDGLTVQMYAENTDEQDKEDVEDDIDNNWGKNVDVKSLKVTKDYIKATLAFEDFKDFFGFDIMDIEDLLSDQLYLDDNEALADAGYLKDYKSGDDVTEKEIDKIEEDAKVLVCYGEKIYVKVPGTILMVAGKYEEKSKNTVYLKRTDSDLSYYVVIYK